MENAQPNETKPGDPDYFACTCSDKGLKECQQLLEEVKSLLQAEDANLLTKIIFSLNWDYGAEITSIRSDMWFGIWSKTRDISTVNYQEIEPPVFFTEIQCDSMEHGIAATWFSYHKKFGEKRIKT